MRILHLLSQQEVTGAEVFASLLSRVQNAQDDRLWVASDTLHMPFPADYIEVPLHNRRWKSRFSNIMRIRSILKEHKIEVIHAHSRAASWVGHFARKGLGIPLVSSIHGMQHLHWSSKRSWKIYGNHLLPVCEGIAEHLERDLGVPQSRITLIRNLFPDAEPVKVLSRKPLAWVGRTTGPKGEALVHLLRESLPLLLDKNPDLEFWIVGGEMRQLSAENQEVFRKLKEKFGDRVLEKGFVPHIREIYESVSGVIGAGRVAIECLQAGIPLYCIGEAYQLGPYTERRRREFQASNFGDVKIDSLQQRPEGFSPETLVTVVPAEKWMEEVFLTPEKFIPSREVSNRLFADYSIPVNLEKIQSVYQKVVREEHYRHTQGEAWLPVWMFHRVSDGELNDHHRTFVSKDRLRKYFQFLKSKGFSPITFREYSEMTLLGTLPRKPIILTFDDGYEDNHRNLLPLLKEFGFKAVIYLLANSELKRNTWDDTQDRLLNPEQIREMTRSGHIGWGSHGLTHRKFSEMTSTEILEELRESKRIIREWTGESPVSFAYPYGVSVSPAVRALTFEAGYQFAVCTDQGGASLEEDPLNIYRVNMFPNETKFSLFKKSSRLYRSYYKWRRGTKAESSVPTAPY